MSQTGFFKLVQHGFIIALLCVGAAVGQLATAAEVKPIAVEVVGEPGSMRPVAEQSEQSEQSEQAEQSEPSNHRITAAPPAPSAAHYYPNKEMHWSGMRHDALIPIVALFFIFGGPVILVIVLAVLRNRTAARREAARAETIARYLESGRDVPPELLHGGTVEQKAENNLRKGITNLGMGIGLTIFLVNFLGTGIGSIGFVVIGMGLSQLAIWKLIDSKKVPVDKVPVSTDSDTYRS
jgi:hypothetical protein